LDQIAQAFGRSVLTPDGTLDRKKLGEIIYADEAKRKVLEQITHPLIFARFGELTEQAEARGESHVVYDAPLLFERGLHHMMASTIVVWVPRSIQLERLMLRDAIDLEAAEKRLASQMPLDEKRALANYVIDNSKTREHTQAQAEFVWRSLMRTP
jgi:dephospho-CoA kinase